MSLANIVWVPSDYADMSVIAREAGEGMLARLDWMTLQPKVIIDMGCATGEMSAHIKKRYPDATLLALDMTESMLQYAKNQLPHLPYVCADAEKLPLRDHTVDLIFANFLLPWHSDHKQLLREWQRVLRPDGVLMLTTLGLDTLQEWREFVNAEQLPQLTDMHDIGDLLLQVGFADPVLDVDHYTTTYKNKEKLITELCGSGMLAASHADYLRAAEIVPDNDGTWPVTYEVVYAHAFAPRAQAGFTADSDGVAKVPLASLRRAPLTKETD